MRKVMTVVIACSALSAALVSGAAAQDARKPDSAATTLEQVLAELRALRAEMSQAASATVRAQLLIARLALQEQRITVVSREISEIQGKLEANEAARPMANLWKSMNDQAPGAKPGKDTEPNPVLDAIRGQADALDKADRELKERHAELSRVLADEQARWTSFNAQLDALERALSGR